MKAKFTPTDTSFSDYGYAQKYVQKRLSRG